ncbi:DUF1648 domain-containing protein [Gordonia shandongensis]|uniref:DUF1648 domain-containing protein n=1 Tax=Gordonia shandongensis TaxID=376351 RepID=UPI0004196819|nr:DUF1648 domain-containing protein [Gordonia shandongensis]
MSRSPRTPAPRSSAGFILVGAGIPLVAVAVAAVVQGLAWPDLPDRIAVHWSADGDPAGWGSPWTLLAITVGVGLGLPALLVAPNIRPLRQGSAGSSFAYLAAVSAATAVGVSTILTWTVLEQTRDDAVRPGLISLVGVAAAVGVGLAAWLLLPRDTPPPTRSATPITTSGRERLLWISTETIGPAIGLLVVAIAVVTLVVVTTAGLHGDSASALLVPLIVLAATALTVASTMAFHVRIDQSGLTVRSLIGLPRFRIAAADVAEVATTDVSPLRQFGGWGIRFRPGALGVVLRSGPALTVTKSGGRTFVVTMRDAQTAASVLAAVADVSAR